MTDGRTKEVDLLKRDARRWVTRLVSGEATIADAEALVRWRRLSPSHEAAYAEALRLWKSLGPGGRTFIQQQGMPSWSGHPARMRRRAFLAGAGTLAAAAVAYGFVDPPLGLWPSFDELQADYRTATGEQRRITLADVVVRMNTQTSIAVAAGGGGEAQRVTLIAGEASFVMPPQPHGSLIVEAAGGRTVASRGRFDVRHAGASVCVTCLDGEVRVERGGEAVALDAGRQLSYGEAGLEESAAIDPVEAASWQDGFIVFRYTPLAAAVAEINRYRPGKVILLNAALGRRAVSGRFRIDRIDEVLAWIERATGASARPLPGGIVLLS
ncbi:sensor [Aliidongia dinghuensis]|uniref:Sensor n=1 Tax=Aliidongia dinghuensis TaxID=1867774 RepID=A0A8J2YZ23_9PROT|nr:FecR domain-containing protein [Aliidongia dinghuensis]GGF44212.1 sensor [Aliidongia dinghuensis]